MKLIDRIIATLEYFTERQHEEVLDCIPAPDQERYSNSWQSELDEQVRIYEHYRRMLESTRRSRTTLSIDRDLLDQIIEHIDAMEEE